MQKTHLQLVFFCASPEEMQYIHVSYFHFNECYTLQDICRITGLHNKDTDDKEDLELIITFFYLKHNTFIKEHRQDFSSCFLKQ